jgi:hypothetical protein
MNENYISVLSNFASELYKLNMSMPYEIIVDHSDYYKIAEQLQNSSRYTLETIDLYNRFPSEITINFPSGSMKIRPGNKNENK